MEIVRYCTKSSPTPRIGVHEGAGIVDLAGRASLDELWSLSVAQLRSELGRVRAANGTSVADATILAPIDGRTEVWAAGVTYEISREARLEESKHSANVYEQVYGAGRPELFFKSTAWRVSGPGDPIGVREDSTLDVPEPEVALVVNQYGEIVGLTVCNDVSSRSIEGENPLYLPQAKIYMGACALGPGIRPIWEVSDPYNLDISLTITRDGTVAWSGSANSRRLHRRYEELVRYLFIADRHPAGVVLATGTCLVPEAPFGLEPGDRVAITVSEVGTLENDVARGLAQLDEARAGR